MIFFLKKKRVMQIDRGDDWATIWMYSLNYTLRYGYNGKCDVYFNTIFQIVKKKNIKNIKCIEEHLACIKHSINPQE